MKFLFFYLYQMISETAMATFLPATFLLINNLDSLFKYIILANTTRNKYFFLKRSGM